MRGILTTREKEVFALLVNGLTTKEIATSLKISEKTVRNHISNVMQKLGVKGNGRIFSAESGHEKCGSLALRGIRV